MDLQTRYDPFDQSSRLSPPKRVFSPYWNFCMPFIGFGVEASTMATSNTLIMASYIGFVPSAVMSAPIHNSPSLKGSKMSRSFSAKPRYCLNPAVNSVVMAPKPAASISFVFGFH